MKQLRRRLRQTILPGWGWEGEGGIYEGAQHSRGVVQVCGVWRGPWRRGLVEVRGEELGKVRCVGRRL